MDIMNEIDRLIENLNTEKVDSDRNVHLEVSPVGNQPSEYDPDFLDSILNEVVGGDVSKLDYSGNGHFSTALSSVASEQPAQLKLQDTTPFGHSNSSVSNLCVTETDLLANHQEINATASAPIATVSYQLNDQRVVILPVSLSPDQNVPVILTDTLPFQPINANRAVPTIAALGKNHNREATASASATTKTANPPGSRKRKLYEEEEFSDQEQEKKRQNAINAKNYRVKTKQTIQDLQQKLSCKEAECVALSMKVEEMKKTLEEERSAHFLEISAQRKLNEELMHKLRIWKHLMNY